MPDSWPHFHFAIRTLIESCFTTDTPIIDVGAGWGIYARMLRQFPIDCIEIHEAYVEHFKLRELYNNVFVMNALDFDFFGYELTILGDVLEHFTVEDANKILGKIVDAGSHFLIQVPYLFEQGPANGNIYEEHLQPDLTHEVVLERYSHHGIKFFLRNEHLGVYSSFSPDQR